MKEELLKELKFTEATVCKWFREDEGVCMMDGCAGCDPEACHDYRPRGQTSNVEQNF